MPLDLKESAIREMTRWSGRSWWAALYRDGHVLTEWNTLMNTVLTPLGLGRTSRWEEVPKKGLISLRLLCPNGDIAELNSMHEHKFFQLKVGGWSTAAGQYTKAHIIGVVDAPDGHCTCWAWEVEERRLVQFRDCVYQMRYRQIGALSLEIQQLRL